jgi:hypothetical protein
MNLSILMFRFWWVEWLHFALGFIGCVFFPSQVLQQYVIVVPVTHGGGDGDNIMYDSQEYTFFSTQLLPEMQLLQVYAALYAALLMWITIQLLPSSAAVRNYFWKIPGLRLIVNSSIRAQIDVLATSHCVFCVFYFVLCAFDVRCFFLASLNQYPIVLSRILVAAVHLVFANIHLGIAIMWWRRMRQ